jgi:ketosteroid isomerase-like protein
VPRYRLTVADRLVTRYHVYEDSLTVARAFGAGE